MSSSWGLILGSYSLLKIKYIHFELMLVIIRTGWLKYCRFDGLFIYIFLFKPSKFHRFLVLALESTRGRGPLVGPEVRIEKRWNLHYQQMPFCPRPYSHWWIPKPESKSAEIFITNRNAALPTSLLRQSLPNNSLLNISSKYIKLFLAKKNLQPVLKPEAAPNLPAAKGGGVRGGKNIASGNFALLRSPGSFVWPGTERRQQMFSSQ